MGTSTPYGGQKGKTPLIPTWLDGEPAIGSELNEPSGEKPGEPEQVVSDAPLAIPTLPPQTQILDVGDPNRFTGARSSFTRFARSGNSNNLRRAIAQYVSTATGGARQAAMRMGASRGAASRLIGFMADAESRGVENALRSITFESLAGRPLLEVLVGLTDYICPGASTVDEGIAREAYLETLIELADEGWSTSTNFNSEELFAVFEIFTTHAIEARICNDIGMNAITMPRDAKAAHAIEKQLREFIRNCVSDALNQAQASSISLTNQRVQSFVDQIYENSFAVLQALAESEVEE